jgi:hypothetical protein
MNRRLKICAAFVLALATLSYVPKASAQAKDACTLVVPADIEAVLGEPVRPPMKESHASTTLQVSTCRFFPSQSQGKMLSVMLNQVSANDSASNTPMSLYLKKMNFTNLQQVSGVGTDAAWGSITLGGKLICQMQARKDKTTWITIMLTGLPDDPDTLKRVKTLANQVLSKIVE